MHFKKYFIWYLRKMDFERSVYCLSHYMNTDKLICNCFIFMELDIVVDFIIHTF